jgi:hypothetical protein
LSRNAYRLNGPSMRKIKAAEAIEPPPAQPATPPGSRWQRVERAKK